MDKEERQFLEKLQRDIDYRFQKIKEMNYDLQNKIMQLQRIDSMLYRHEQYLFSYFAFLEKIRNWFRRRFRSDQRSFKMP